MNIIKYKTLLSKNIKHINIIVINVIAYYHRNKFDNKINVIAYYHRNKFDNKINVIAYYHRNKFDNKIR
jgi:hypothetical protein